MSIDGIEVFPSQANFLLMRVKDADSIFEQLKEKNILIKSMNKHGGLLKECLRITIGNKDENSALLSALKEIMA